MHERRQSGHPRGRNVRVGRHTIIGQAVPCRKGKDRQIRRKKLQAGAHHGQAFVVARNMKNSARLFGLGHQKLGIKALRRTADGDMVFPFRAHLLTKRAIGEVLVHAPKRGHKDRDHPDHLRDRALAKH